MDSKKLKELFQQLTPEEKIAQTIQLNGSLVIENEVMSTGPMQDLGLPKSLKILATPSLAPSEDREQDPAWVKRSHEGHFGNILWRSSQRLARSGQNHKNLLAQGGSEKSSETHR